MKVHSFRDHQDPAPARPFMPVIKPSCVRDLKMRVNLADVVSRVATLKRAGSRMKGLCPFHSEKSPSFHVDPDKGLYKCFGCGKAGDVISFVRETEQLSFTEAVEALGQRFSIVIEYEEGSGPTREERSLRQEIFEIHDQATEYFSEMFKSATPAGDYMREYWVARRKFPLELAEEFKIGAAAPDDAGLAARLLKRKYSEEALRQSGLFFIREDALLSLGTLRPRFRGRLMVPIRDHQGRVVAFTARQTDLTPGDDPAREAKYVNSPETPIFTKGNLLFNLDRARTAAGEGKPFVIVEGQLDALRCWQVGLKTAVAPQGTSITDGQLLLMRRYHAEAECFFDSDSAGQKASLRLIPLALKAGIEVRFLTLAGESKVDPDLLFLERGLAAYEDLKRHAMTSMAFAARAHLPQPAAASPEHKARAAQDILSIIAVAESEVARSAYIEEVATYLGFPAAALHRDFQRMTARAPRVGGDTSKPAQPAARVGVAPEQDLLMLCLHFETLGKPLSAAIPAEWIDLTHPAGVLLNRFLAEFEQNSWPGRDHLDAILETPEEKSLIATLLFSTPKLDDPIKAAQEGLNQLRNRALEPRLRQIALALASSDTDINADPISLLKERSDIQRQLRSPLPLVVVG